MIKTVLEEEGSAIADELWRRASARVASRLVYPEARAALAAAERSGRIDQAGRRIAVADLDAACTAMVLVGIDWGLAQHAGEIAELYALRGYDAVHLATALSVEEPDLALLTWDHDLAEAAVRAGRAVVPA